MIIQNKTKLVRSFKLMTTYLVGQGGTQLIQVVTGFLIIRLLSKEAYADYTMVHVVLGMGTVLFGLGVSQCLTGLIGKDINNKEIVGRYVAAAYQLRKWLLSVGAVVLLFTFIAISTKFGWNLWLALFYFGCVALTLFFNAWETVNKPILLLEYRLREMYTLSCGLCLGRLICISLAAVCGVLFAPVAVFFNVLQAAGSALGVGRLSRSRKGPVSKDTDLSFERSEILRLTLPKLPNLLVATFSSQLMLILAAIFATTSTLAEAGALSRLALLFLIFRQMGETLVAPYFAKLDPGQLLRQVSLLLLALCFFISGAIVLGYFYPDPFLLLLGEGYGDLEFEIFLVLTIAAIRVATGTIMSVCNARKFIYFWHSLVTLPPRFLLMFLGIIYLDLGSLKQLLILDLSIVVVGAIIRLGILAYGINQTHRSNPST